MALGYWPVVAWLPKDQRMLYGSSQGGYHVLWVAKGVEDRYYKEVWNGRELFLDGTDEHSRYIAFLRTRVLKDHVVSVHGGWLNEDGYWFADDERPELDEFAYAEALAERHYNRDKLNRLRAKGNLR